MKHPEVHVCCTGIQRLPKEESRTCPHWRCAQLLGWEGWIAEACPAPFSRTTEHPLSRASVNTYRVRDMYLRYLKKALHSSHNTACQSGRHWTVRGTARSELRAMTMLLTRDDIKVSQACGLFLADNLHALSLRTVAASRPVKRPFALVVWLAEAVQAMDPYDTNHHHHDIDLWCCP